MTEYYVRVPFDEYDASDEDAATDDHGDARDRQNGELCVWEEESPEE